MASSGAQVDAAHWELMDLEGLRRQQQADAAELAASRAAAEQLQQQLATALADLEELQARWGARAWPGLAWPSRRLLCVGPGMPKAPRHLVRSLSASRGP